jgi:hypothetical protein
MWVLGLLILAIPLLLVGALASVIWYLVSPRGSRPNAKKLIAIPVGFVAVPLVVLLLAPAFEKSDFALYDELFGAGTTVPKESMLFDEFGDGREREIYMQIFTDSREREFLFGIQGLTPSEMTRSEFADRGDQHGFTWWISSAPETAMEWDYCATARVFEADGFRGWKQFRIAECVARESELTSAVSRGPIYVIAWHRD